MRETCFCNKNVSFLCFCVSPSLSEWPLDGTQRRLEGHWILRASSRSTMRHTSSEQGAQPERTRTENTSKSQIRSPGKGDLNLSEWLHCRFWKPWRNTSPAWPCSSHACRSWGGKSLWTYHLVAAESWLSCPALRAARRDRDPFATQNHNQMLINTCDHILKLFH